MRLLGSGGQERVVGGRQAPRVAVTLATCQTPAREPPAYAVGVAGGAGGGGAVGAHSCGAGGGAD